jgi:hypothetical protein
MIFKTIGYIAFSVSMLSAVAVAQQSPSERVSNIEKATSEIGAFQKQLGPKLGPEGALAAVVACYLRELPTAQKWTPALEACMAQDIVVAQTTAALLDILRTAGRKVPGAPEPEELVKEMSKRVYGVLTRFDVPMEDARAWSDIVKQQGMAAYRRHIPAPASLPPPGVTNWPRPGPPAPDGK